MITKGTLFTGHTVDKLDKVDSTNRYALDLVKQHPPAEGFTVWALEQFAGRGQRGNKSLTEPRTNLTFSIILLPRFLPLAEQFWLTRVMALAVAEFVSSCLQSGSEKVAIKWPNDIYVNDQKIAGILIENVIEQSTIKFSVAGIGININQSAFDPSVPNATSLKLLTGSTFDLEDCLNRIFIPVEKFYLELRSGNYKKIDEAYHKLLYRRGVLCNLSINGKACKGTIKGVSATGQLLIDTDTGEHNTIEPLELSDVKHLVFL
ncbi:MAG TPA: biotin--[acetyl-CoA-carboxylase] ligase [Bacteroidia bacterium]|nr:biotin--[acetyl-CoA-carboxylase] ligase [Bacteroidia bacterium]